MSTAVHIKATFVTHLYDADADYRAEKKIDHPAEYHSAASLLSAKSQKRGKNDPKPAAKKPLYTVPTPVNHFLSYIIQETAQLVIRTDLFKQSALLREDGSIDYIKLHAELATLALTNPSAKTLKILVAPMLEAEISLPEHVNNIHVDISNRAYEAVMIKKDMIMFAARIINEILCEIATKCVWVFIMFKQKIVLSEIFRFLYCNSKDDSTVITVMETFESWRSMMFPAAPKKPAQPKAKGQVLAIISADQVKAPEELPNTATYVEELKNATKSDSDSLVTEESESSSSYVTSSSSSLED